MAKNTHYLLLFHSVSLENDQHNKAEKDENKADRHHDCQALTSECVYAFMLPYMRLYVFVYVFVCLFVCLFVLFMLV